MVVKFKKDVTFKNDSYFKDDELKVTKQNIDDVWNLNEKGFIYPIEYKDYLKLKKELNKKEDKDGTII